MPGHAGVQIPFLPGYPRPDFTRENFHKQQLCNVRQGSSFVQRPPGAPIVPSAHDAASGARPATAGAAARLDRRVGWAIGTSTPAYAAAPVRAYAPPPAPVAMVERERERERSLASAELGVPGGWTANEVARARAFQVEELLPEPPRWARDAHDATLSFGGFFREYVDAGEPSGYERVRACALVYHVGDGTALVYERPKENSGMPQGVLLKRHRIRSPSGGFYELRDLNVGETLDCYGRRITLTSADAFTRAFLSARGVHVPPDSAVPPDPSASQAWPPGRPATHDAHDEITPPRGGAGAGAGAPAAAAELTALQRFLEYDRVVLRYYLVWDEGPPHNCQRQLELRYFLADGTAELHEDRASHARARRGFDTLPFVVGRTRIPLKYTQASAASFGVPSEARTLSPADLQIGAVVDVFGRKCTVHDADAATRAWAEANGTPLGRAVTARVLAGDAPTPARAMPPHSGFGSEEDSLASVRGGLVPRAQPRRDIFRPKHAAQPGSTDVGTHSTAGRALRFNASLAHASVDDESRRFVVSFFLEDGTLSVFEAREPNSGHVGGLFLERTRVPLPRAHAGRAAAVASSGRAGGAHYSAHDLTPGAELDLFGRKLVLHSADAFSARYLAEHAAELDRQRRADADAAAAAHAAADADAAATALAEATDAAARAGGTAVDVARVDRLEAQLRDVLLARSAQIRTVFRRIDRNADGRITLSEFATLLSELHFELNAEVRARRVARARSASARSRLRACASRGRPRGGWRRAGGRGAHAPLRQERRRLHLLRLVLRGGHPKGLHVWQHRRARAAGHGAAAPRAGHGRAAAHVRARRA